MNIPGSRCGFVCDQCRKQYVTDNTWLLCDKDTELTVLATFCSERCRTEYVCDKTPRSDRDQYPTDSANVG